MLLIMMIFLSLSLSLSLSIYIYIYCHPQTDCFAVSQHFRVARHAGCFKLGFRLYVSYRSALSDPRQLGNHNELCISFCLLTFCVTGFRSAYFIRRTMNYAAGLRCVLCLHLVSIQDGFCLLLFILISPQKLVSCLFSLVKLLDWYCIEGL